MRRLRFTRQEGMLGVLFYPRFWPEPDGTACNTSVWGPWDLATRKATHVWPSIFPSEGNSTRPYGLDAWGIFSVISFGLSEGVLRVPQNSVQARAASSRVGLGAAGTRLDW